METQELDTGEDIERFSWIQLPILTLERAGFDFWRLRSWIFYYYELVLGVLWADIGSSMSWYWEYYELVLGVV